MSSVMASALDTLGRRLGIEERFRDAAGEIRETAEETRRLLLAAMGIAAADEDEAANSLTLLDRAEWGRALPPAWVDLADDNPCAVPISVPNVVPNVDRSDSKSVSWTLVLESGETRSGTANLRSTLYPATAELDGLRFERHSLTLEQDIPWGYHQLRSNIDESVCTLIVSPGHAWLPEVARAGRRLWGVAAQLYLLRSARNWGIGDFSDLRALVDLVKKQGGDVVGLNPLHAMFLDNPEHASPYSPESRLLLNVLNIDVEAIPELTDSPEVRDLIASQDFQQALEASRSTSLVDYTAVARLKLRALRLLFDCQKAAGAAGRWLEFEAFRASRGSSFERNCLFEALRHHFSGIDGRLAGWHSWPTAYRDYRSPAVAVFAQEHEAAVTFCAWLQWLADQQLAAAADAARDMQVGLYRDLAVGADPSGAATWSEPAAIVFDIEVGAPPDIGNPAGQNWGLPPFHPGLLRESGYRHFIELIRANMRHAGGLRIDHVMALQHLYWIPRGMPPEKGGYVQYPLDDLLGILALESHRNRCLLVGEDLGTVPEGFRERMLEANILSYRVLFFERDEGTGAFLPPESYPRLALAVTGSHDLPTVPGWWDGSDLDIRERLNLFPGKNVNAKAREQRSRDKDALLAALRALQLLPTDGPVPIEGLVAAVHAWLARTEAFIVMAQLDDITAEEDPVNVPATSDEHANWRRKLSLTMEQLASRPCFERLTRPLREIRR